MDAKTIKKFVSSRWCTWGGGALVFEVGYHTCKKIHVIRVVFQDQAMYARTSFWGAKMCKIGKKGCVFSHIDKFWKGHDGQINKNTCKNAYVGSIFIPEKYMFRVCFESPFTRMISSLKYKCPPPPPPCTFLFWSHFSCISFFVSAAKETRGLFLKCEVPWQQQSELVP